jgi:FtsZ-binding cell division protein ZapB
VPDTLSPTRINQLIALNYYSLMYYDKKITTAESEVNLLRVMASTLNAQNEQLADEVRKARLEHARVELQNNELREKLERRNKALAIVSGISLVIIAALALT